MVKFPFPGSLTEQERLNFSVLESKESLHQVYFTFDKTNFQYSKQIVVLPPNSLIYGIIFTRIIETFAPGLFRLFVGTKDSIFSILDATISVPIVNIHLPSGSPNYFNIFTVNTPILVAINNVDLIRISAPTQGRGFGILCWLDLNKVPGYR